MEALPTRESAVTSSQAAVTSNREAATSRVETVTHTVEASSHYDPGFWGKALYHGLPVRRGVVLSNLRRVFGERRDESQIEALAKAFYGHMARTFWECLSLPWLSRERRRALVRVENAESPIAAAMENRGVLILTGHLGNWEVAPVLGLGGFSAYRGRLHILRRQVHPRWLDQLVTRRFERAGLGVIPKSGSLSRILDLLEAGDGVVFIMDQHAARKDGVDVEFFGHPARTFKSLAMIALATRAPVVPAHCWREPDGRHVLRFEDPLPLIERDDPGEAIRANTQAYNQALERMILQHPEQWFWVHRRWKVSK